MNCLTPVIPEMIGTGFERSYFRTCYFRTLAAAGPRIREGLFGGLAKTLVFKGVPWQWKWAARRGRGDVAQGSSVSGLLMTAQIQDRVRPNLLASSPYSCFPSAIGRSRGRLPATPCTTGVAWSVAATDLWGRRRGDRGLEGPQLGGGPVDRLGRSGGIELHGAITRAGVVPIAPRFRGVGRRRRGRGRPAVAAPVGSVPRPVATRRAAAARGLDGRDGRQDGSSGDDRRVRAGAEGPLRERPGWPRTSSGSVLCCAVGAAGGPLVGVAGGDPRGMDRRGQPAGCDRASRWPVDGAGARMATAALRWRAQLRQRVDVSSIHTNSTERGRTEPGRSWIRLGVPNRIRAVRDFWLDHC